MCGRIPLLRPFGFRRSRFNRLAKKTVTVNPATAAVDARKDANVIKFVAETLDNLILRLARFVGVHIEVQPLDHGYVVFRAPATP